VAAPVEVQAYVLNADIDAAGDLSTTAISDQSIDALVVAGSAAASGGAVGVAVSGAGAVAINTITTDVRSFIDYDIGSGARLTDIDTGSVTMLAQDTSRITAITGAASLAAAFGGVGVAVSIGFAGAYNEISNEVSAFIHDADVTTTNVAGAIAIVAMEAATINALTMAASLSVGVAGISVKVSGAGAAALNVILTETTAYVTDSTLASAGSVALDASDASTINAIILASSAAISGGAVGVGVSIGGAFATNLIGALGFPTGVQAYVKDSTITATGALTIEATAEETIRAAVVATSVALAAGGVGVGVAGSGVLANNIITTDIKAFIENSTITAGSVSMTADDTSQIMAFAGSAAVSAAVGGVSVAVSIAVALGHNIIDNDVAAYIKGSTVTSTGTGGTSGDIEVHAIEQSQINAVAAAASVGAAIGAVGVKVSGAGAEATNIILTRTNAYVEDSVLDSDNNVIIKAESLSASPAQIALAGFGVANDFANNLNDAGSTDTDDDSTGTDEEALDITEDNLFLASLSLLFTNAAIRNSGSLAVTVRTKGEEWSVTDRITGSSYVVTRDGSNFNVTTPTIAATVISTAAAIAGGAVGVGVSMGVSFARNLIGWQLDFDVPYDLTTGSEPAFLQSGVVLGLGDRVKIEEGVRAGDIYEYIGADPLIPDFANGEITVNLRTQDYGNTDLWKQVNLVKAPVEVQAYVLNSEIDAVGDLSTTAVSDQSIDAIVVAGSVALSAGAVGVAVSGAGAVAINTITTDVRSFIDYDIGAGSRLTVIDTGSVTILAKDTSTINAVTGAASLAASVGGVSISVAVGVALAHNEISNEVSAFIHNANVTTTNAAGAVSVQASEAASIRALTSAAAISVGFGAVAVKVSGAGATATNIILTRTNAYISDSTLVSAGGVTLAATDTSSITATVATASAALAGGAVGVGVSIGASIARNLIGYDLLGIKIPAQVQAYIQNSTITATGNLTQTAMANETINATVLSGSAAISAGVVGVAVSGAGVLAINQIASDVKAFSNNSTIDAGAISLSAVDASTIEADAGAAAVSAAFGLVGVAISVGSAVAENHISNSVEAYITNSTNVITRIGDINLQATETATITAQTAAAAASTAIGAVGVAISGSGAAATNTILTRTSAYVQNSTLNSADDILIKALNTSTIKADVISVSASIGGGVVGISGAIGISVARNYMGYDATTRTPLEVLAYINNSQINAAGTLTLDADAVQSIDANVLAGSSAVSAGLVAGSASGAGATVENWVATQVKSYISNTTGTGVNVDNGITITADDNSTVSSVVAATSIATSIGLVADSVSIGTSNALNIITSEVEAYVDTSTVKTTAGNVSIQAQENVTMTTTSLAASAATSAGLFSSAVSGGGASAINIINTQTRAYINESNLDITGNLDVHARASFTTTALTGAAASAAGIFSIATSGSVAATTMTPVVEAYINNGLSKTVDVSGTVSLISQTSSKVDMNAYGMAGGTIGVGVSSATATITPNIDSYISGSGNVIAGALNLLSLYNVNDNGSMMSGKDVITHATAAAGGLIGVSGSRAVSTTNANMASEIRSGSTLTVTGTTNIKSLINGSNNSSTDGSTGGAIAIGSTSADSISTSLIEAKIGDSVSLLGGDLNIYAGGEEDNWAESVSGVGGAIAVSASSADTMNNSTSRVSIGSGTVTRTIDVDTLTMTADHKTIFNGKTDASSGGAIDASGATISNIVSANVSANISANAFINATDLNVDANNRTVKAALPDSGGKKIYHLVSASGGIGSFPSGGSTSTIINNTSVNIGDGANISLDGSGASTVTAYNNVVARDSAKLDSGGAIAVAKTESIITNNNTALINIGDAGIFSVGDMRLEAYTDANIKTIANTKTYGLAGFAEGEAISTLNVDNDVLIKSGAIVQADGDISLSTGGDAEGHKGILRATAQADLFNQAAIPIAKDPVASATIIDASNITIESTGRASSAADVYLHALESDSTTSGNWTYQDLYQKLAEDIANGIDSLFGGSGDSVSLKKTGGSDSLKTISGVRVDGTVETGIKRQQTLEIGPDILALIPISMTGAPTLTFSTNQVTRSSGTWQDDGFAAAEFITIAGSTSNDGTYRVASISGNVLVLESGNNFTPGSDNTAGMQVLVNNKGTAFAPISVSNAPSLNFTQGANGEITRLSGSWLDDGFLADQFITVIGSASNDDTYQIAVVTDSVIQITSTQTLTTESGVTANVVARASTTGQATMSSDPSLDYIPQRASITRSAGSWTTDGFVEGETIQVGNAGSNDGSYTIIKLTATELELQASSDDVNSGTDTNATVTSDVAQYDGSLTFIPKVDQVLATIVSTGANWNADFAVNDSITVSDAGGNNGNYTISSVTANTITLTSGSGLSTLTDTNGVSITDGTDTITIADGTNTVFTAEVTPVVAKIQRSGSWAANYTAGEQITISGAGTNNGSYTISTVSGSTLELSGSPSLTSTTTTATAVVNISMSGSPTLTFSDKASNSARIERASGSWSSDGFASGNEIIINSSTNNNGTFSVTSVTGSVLELDTAANIQLDEGVTGSTITQFSSFAFGLADGINLDFVAVSGSVPAKMTISSGSWIDAGYIAGQYIEVTGSGSGNDGTYLIASVSALEIELSSVDNLTAESGSSTTLKVLPLGTKLTDAPIGINGVTNLTFSAGAKTITRAAGDWIDDGFQTGGFITILSSTSNDGTYEITALTATVITVEETITAQSAQSSANVQILSVPIQPGGINILQRPDGVADPQIKIEDLAGNITDELNKLQEFKVSMLGNPTSGGINEIAAINAQINQLERQLLDLGLVDASDPGLGDDDVLVSAVSGYQISVIEVPQITAQSGDIFIMADTLTGSGVLDAPGDAEIKVINESPFYLRLEGLNIPDEGGRIRFNNVRVFNNEEIQAHNIAGQQANFTNINSYWTTADPLIEVTSTFDPNLPGDYAGAPAPDIEIVGDLSNIQGTLRVVNNKGSIIVKSPNGSVNAKTIDINAGRDIVIASDIHHIAGDPVGQWDADAENFEELAKKDADGNYITTNQSGTVAGVKSAVSSTIAGNNVFITARLLNLNGLVQSGKPDRDLVLDNTLNATMDSHSGTSLLLLTSPTAPIKAWYNPNTDRIEVDTISVEGGYMQLTGNIMSTAQGTLNVADGFGDIDITNNTDRAIDIRSTSTGNDRLLKANGTDSLVFTHNASADDTITRTNGSWLTDGFYDGQRISIVGSTQGNDASYRIVTVTNKVLTLVSTETLTNESAGVASVEVRGHGNGIEGTLVITDTAKPPVGTTPFTTTWTRIGDDIQVSDNNGGSSVINNTRSASYDTLNNQRYYWLTGNSFSATTVEKWVSRSFWGASWLVADPPKPPTSYNYTPALPTTPLIPAGFTSNTFAAVANSADNNTGYRYEWDESSSTTVTRSNNTESFGWWIFSYQEHTLTKTSQEGGKEFHTHSVKADYDVNINFIGNDTGSIDVTSIKDINVDGPISNLSGTTTLTSTQGSIKESSVFGIIKSEDTVLSAALGTIGTSTTALRTDSQGGFINATASGDIWLKEHGDEMLIGTITSTNGDVLLEADVITALNGTTLVTGDNIELQAHAGAIGSSTQALRINMGTASGDTLKASALDDVYIQETAGDLLLEQVSSKNGDVHITVDAGDLLDANTAGKADTRAIAALQGLWSDLELTIATGANSARDENVQAYESLKTREYHTYWRYRDQQPDPSVYDAGFQVQISAEEENFYRTELGFDNNAIDALNLKRTAEYHALHNDYGALGNTHNESYSYSVTVGSTEYNNLTEGFAWTESSLENSISVGAFREKTDTELVIEDPNIIANDVVLDVNGGIGAVTGNVLINLASGIGGLTANQKLLLAAAESDDMVFLDAGGNIVDPNDTTATATQLQITKRDDLDVRASGNISIDADDHIYLGAEQDINIDTIVAGGEIRIKGGSGIYTIFTDARTNIAGGNLILEAANSNISGNLSLDFTANSITRSSGSWLDEGFLVGQTIILTDRIGTTVNEGSYQISALTANTLTLVQNTLSVESSVTGVTVEVAETESNGLSLDFGINTIVRSTGSWTGEGFVVGQTIKVTGEGAAILNGGSYTISAVSGDGLTLTLADTLITEAGTSDVSIVASGAAAHAALQIDLLPGATLTARALGTIFLREKNGEMGINTIFSSSAGVRLAGDDIVDVNDDALWNIKAESLDINASAAVGAAANALDIDLPNNSGLLNVTAVGDINIIEIIGDLNVGHVRSTTGDVELTAAVSILDRGFEVNGLPSKPEEDVIGNSITLTALAGGIGESGNDLDINSAFSGAGVLTSTSFSNAYIIETAGDLSLFQVSTQPGNIAFILSAVSILNGNGGGDNVVSGSTRLFAGGDIGAAGNKLMTSVGALEGLSTGGDVWIHNTGALTMGGVTGATEIISNGDVNVTASSPVTVSVSQTANTITILATDDDEAIPANVAEDDLIVQNGVILTSTVGDIILQAGDDLDIDAGASLVSAGAIELYGDFGNADAGKGTIMDIKGILDATTTVLIRSENDDDIIVLKANQDATTIQSLDGNDKIYLGSMANPTGSAGGVLSDITADVNIDGGTHSTGDQLILDDTANIAANSGTITATTITGFGLGGTLTYNEIENLDFNLGSGNDTIEILGSSGDTTINTGAGDDTFNIRGTTAGAQVTVEGDVGADTFNVSSDAPTNTGTVNAIAGNIIITGGDDSDTVNLSDAGDATDNSLTVTATTLTGAGMTGIITYGTIEQLDIDLGSGNDSLDIQTTATGVQTTINANDGNDQFNVTTTGANTQTSFFGDAGNDQINILTTGVGAQTTISGNAGDDTVNIQTTATGSQTTISGEAGVDTFNISSDAPTNSGNTDGIVGNISIDGGSEADVLNLSDAADTTDNSITMTSTGLSGLGMVGVIDYGDIEQVDVALGSGNDTVDVQSTAAGIQTNISGNAGNDQIDVLTTGINSQTTISGDSGDDQINITTTGNNAQTTLTGDAGNDEFNIAATGTSAQTTISGNTGDDTFNLQSTATGSQTTINGDAGVDTFNISSDAPTNSGNTDGIAGNVSIDGGTEADVLNLSDAGDTTDNSLTLTATTLAGVGMTGVIDYGTVEQLDVDMGSGNDTVDIQSTAAGVVTNLNTNAGDDSVNVKATAATSQTNIDGSTGNDRITISSNAPDTNGTVNDIFGGIDVNGGDGINSLTVSDEANTLAKTTTITDNTITGLAPATITYHSNGGIFLGDANVITGLGDDHIIVDIDESAVGAERIVHGNEGNDVIDASAVTGNVIIFGDQGDDTLIGSAFNDILIGGTGDLVFVDGQVVLLVVENDLDEGNDILLGGAGNDVIIGGAGVDELNGGTGDDILFGDGGQVEFVNGVPQVFTAVSEADGGDDILSGDDGNDVLFGGGGQDQLGGGTGDDILIGDGGQVSFVNGVPQVITVVSEAGGQDDSLSGDDGNDVLFGGGGLDQLGGGSGNDILMGDGGQVNYSAGQVQIVQVDPGSGGDDDVLAGDTGDDIMFGAGGNDELAGGEGNDFIIGDSGQVSFVNGVPQVITVVSHADGQNDVLSGDDGNDVLFGGGGLDQLGGGSGNDVVMGDGGQVSYSAGQVHIVQVDPGSGGDDDVLAGDAGDDIMFGAGGNDEVAGGSGNDFIIGDTGRVTFRGNQGTTAETIDEGQGGDDLLSGGEGNDIMFGGSGRNVFDGTLSEDLLADIAKVTIKNNRVLRLDYGEDVQGGLLSKTLSSLYSGKGQPNQDKASVVTLVSDQENGTFTEAPETIPSDVVQEFFPDSNKRNAREIQLRADEQVKLPLTDSTEDSKQEKRKSSHEQGLQNELPQHEQTIPNSGEDVRPGTADEQLLEPSPSLPEDESTTRAYDIPLAGLVAGLSGWQMKQAGRTKSRNRIHLNDDLRVQRERVLHWNENEAVLIDKQADHQGKPWYTSYKKLPTIH
jgi:Ca2+-binding RTX toxin-like protein